MTWKVLRHEEDETGVYRNIAQHGSKFPQWRISVTFQPDDGEMPNRLDLSFAYATQPGGFYTEGSVDPPILPHVAEVVARAAVRFGPGGAHEARSEAFGDGAVQGIPPHQEAVGALMGALVEGQGGSPGNPLSSIQGAAATALERLAADSPAQRAVYQMALQFFPEAEAEPEPE